MLEIDHKYLFDIENCVLNNFENNGGFDGIEYLYNHSNPNV
jgi:hypothetical protein